MKLSPWMLSLAQAPAPATKTDEAAAPPLAVDHANLVDPKPVHATKQV